MHHLPPKTVNPTQMSWFCKTISQNTLQLKWVNAFCFQQFKQHLAKALPSLFHWTNVVRNFCQCWQMHLIDCRFCLMRLHFCVCVQSLWKQSTQCKCKNQTCCMHFVKKNSMRWMEPFHVQLLTVKQEELQAEHFTCVWNCSLTIQSLFWLTKHLTAWGEMRWCVLTTSEKLVNWSSYWHGGAPLVFVESCQSQSMCQQFTKINAKSNANLCSVIDKMKSFIASQHSLADFCSLNGVKSHGFEIAKLTQRQFVQESEIPNYLNFAMTPWLTVFYCHSIHLVCSQKAIASKI